MNSTTHATVNFLRVCAPVISPTTGDKHKVLAWTYCNTLNLVQGWSSHNQLFVNLLLILYSCLNNYNVIFCLLWVYLDICGQDVTWYCICLGCYTRFSIWKLFIDVIFLFLSRQKSHWKTSALNCTYMCPWTGTSSWWPGEMLLLCYSL